MTMLASVSHRPLLPILLALSGAHLLNDLISSMIPAMYPLLKEAYQLDFTKIGLITLAFQVTSSLLQPIFGFVTDHKPWPYAMVAGMAATLSGVVGLACAGNYAMVLVSVAMVGLGSAVFHPEATRMAAMLRRANRALHRASSRLAATPDTPLGRCLLRCLWFHAARRRSAGCQWWHSSRCC